MDLFVESAPVVKGSIQKGRSVKTPTLFRTRLFPQERAARIAHAMHATFEARGVRAKAWALDVDLTGARVEPPGEVLAPGLEPVL